ncbi:MAG TPA: hypothetical protein VE866_11045 [Candidatus Binatia bacterium]|nr:hypothetical protein [Candidatus Binatia bacterium]
MKTRKQFAFMTIVVSLMLLAASSVWAQNAPVTIPSDWVINGRTYAEWSAAWEQWSYSIPTAQHPLFDNGDCSVGQSGPVWFLGGKYCYNGGICAYTGVVRSCSVPSGKKLYVAILNGEDSALEESVAENPGNELAQQIASMRSYEDVSMSPASVYLWVDGAPVPRLKDRFRVQSTAFGFSIPTDNLLAAVYPPGYNTFPTGTYFPAVDDG